MLPEPSNAPRPEPIYVISEELRDSKVGNGPQQVIVETADSLYLTELRACIEICLGSVRLPVS